MLASMIIPACLSEVPAAIFGDHSYRSDLYQ